MSLQTIRSGPATNRNVQEDALKLLKQLRLKQVVVAGAGANADIAVAGIVTADQLISVIEVPASAALVDRTSVATINSAGNIRLTQATTGNQLIVTYWDVS